MQVWDQPALAPTVSRVSSYRPDSLLIHLDGCARAFRGNAGRRRPRDSALARVCEPPPAERCRRGRTIRTVRGRGFIIPCFVDCIATETSPLGSPAPALSFLTRGCDVPGSQPDDRGEHAGLPYRHRDSLSDEAVNCGRGRGGRHRHILDNNISKIAEFIAFSLEQRVNYIVKVIYLPWRA